MGQTGTVRTSVVEGYPRYTISSDGKVVNTVTDREMTVRIGWGGYPCVHLTNEDGSSVLKMHRLLAKAFIPNPKELPCVNHKDEDKTNNSLDNLEWCTRQYNCAYSLAKKWWFTSPEGEQKIIWNLRAFCLEEGLDQGAMHKVHSGKHNQHKGWKRGIPYAIHEELLNTNGV